MGLIFVICKWFARRKQKKGLGSGAVLAYRRASTFNEITYEFPKIGPSSWVDSIRMAT